MNLQKVAELLKPCVGFQNGGTVDLFNSVSQQVRFDFFVGLIIDVWPKGYLLDVSPNTYIHKCRDICSSIPCKLLNDSIF